MNTLERIQYHTALAITGSWKGTNQNKIYEELGWESLSDRRWPRCLFHFYKIQNNLTPPYLRTPIPSIRTHLFGSRSENVLNEVSPKVIVIVSILTALDVGTKLALNYVILSTFSVLNQAFYQLSDPHKENF